MFGNSYTALVVQINGEESGEQIWKDIGANPLMQEVERLWKWTPLVLGTRIWYSDLAFIVLQGDLATMEQVRNVLIDLFNQKYSTLLTRKMLCLVVCPSIAKNTFTRGVWTVQNVWWIESLWWDGGDGGMYATRPCISRVCRYSPLLNPSKSSTGVNIFVWTEL